MGVNCPCFEWTSDGEGHIVKSVKTAIEDWKVNMIRLPTSLDRKLNLEVEDAATAAGWVVVEESGASRGKPWRQSIRLIPRQPTAPRTSHPFRSAGR